jgi:hypothetical protein
MHQNNLPHLMAKQHQADRLKSWSAIADHRLLQNFGLSPQGASPFKKMPHVFQTFYKTA